MDAYDDNGALLRKAFAGRSLPPLISEGVNMASVNTRHPEDYALVVKTASGTNYKFPIVDAANALVSAVYFSEHKNLLPRPLQKIAATKLSVALTAFGLPVPDEFTKTAAIELGYSGEAQDITLEQLFGVEGGGDDEYEVLKDEFEGFSPRGKRRLAMVVKEAGIDMKHISNMEDYLGDLFGSHVNHGFETRKYVTGFEPDAANALDTLMMKVSARSITPAELVDALSAFDLEHGITHQYGRLVPDPVYTAYAGQEKTASASLEINGKTYGDEAITSFAKNSGGQLTEEFGGEFAASFASDPMAVLNSLPEPHKHMIAGMIDAD